MPASDRELIDACLRGDQDAWAELINRYQRLIYSVARKLCPQTEDVPDVFQAVCLDLYQSLKSLRNDRTLPAWLITVSKRRAYAVLRSTRENLPIEDYVAAANPAVDAVEQDFLLERAVGELPERCQTLLRLLYFDPQAPSCVRRVGTLGQ